MKTEAAAIVEIDRETRQIVWKGSWRTNQIVKQVSGARWNPQTAAWSVPLSDGTCEQIVDLAEQSGLDIQVCPTVYHRAESSRNRKMVLEGRFGSWIENVPTRMAPFDHQLRGTQACAWSSTFLMWEMGTGKTKAVVDAVACMSQQEGPQTCLVLCPLAVSPNWRREVLRQWDPSKVGFDAMTVVLNEGSVADKAKALETAYLSAHALGRTLFVVVNYDSAWRFPLGPKTLKSAIASLPEKDRGVVLSKRWSVVVADESQRIKNRDSKCSAMAHAVADRTERRIALSGTPMPNNPMDIWSQARFVEPAAFGHSFYRFREKYAIMGGFKKKEVVGFKDIEEMHKVLYTFASRVTKDEVLELPPLSHVQVPIRLSGRAAQAYRALENGVSVRLEKGEITPTNALVEMLRLQQVTSGIGGYSDAEGNTAYERIGSEKLEALAEILDGIEPKDPVVVFAKWTPDVEGAARTAQEAGRPSYLLSGQANELEAWRRSANAGEGPVLCVQIRAGGVGVEMQEASHAVYLSIGFEWGDFEQSISRLHRQGQKRKVVCHHVVAEDTIDEDVYAAMERKERNALAVLRGRMEARK